VHLLCQAPTSTAMGLWEMWGAEHSQEPAPRDSTTAGRRLLAVDTTYASSVSMGEEITSLL